MNKTNLLNIANYITMIGRTGNFTHHKTELKTYEVTGMQGNSPPIQGRRSSSRP
jgi:hypothetical protein